MNNTKKKAKQRQWEAMRAHAVALKRHQAAGGKVLVKDKHDKTIKQSTIAVIYSDYTVSLDDTVHSDYKVMDLTIIPLENDEDNSTNK